MPDLSGGQFSLFNASDYDVASHQPKGGLMGEDWYRSQRRGNRESRQLAQAQRGYDSMDESEQRLTTRPVSPDRPEGANPYHAPKPGADWNRAEGYIQQAPDGLYDEMMANTPAQGPYAQAAMDRGRVFQPTFRHQFPEAPSQIPTQEFGPGGSISTHQPASQTDMHKAAQMQDVQGLPPVSVKEFPSGMGLTDGNHRVSEALRNGRLWVDSNVHHLDYDVEEPYDERYEGY